MKNNRKFKILFSKYYLGIFLVTFIFCNKANSTNQILVAQTTGNTNIDVLFRDALPVLKSETNIPIFLPTYLPELNGNKPIYANIGFVEKTDYTVILAYAPGCQGGNSCRLGTISGSTEQPEELSLANKKAVPLNNGITGYFVPGTCGANCSDDSIIWKYNNYYYTIGDKGADLQTLIKVANSMIQR